MDSHVRVHAVLCQWIEWFEAEEATDLAAVALDICSTQHASMVADARWLKGMAMAHS